MTGLEDVTLALFTACNSVRMFAYLSQIRSAARDTNGASAISCTTWGVFLVTNISTIAYAVINRHDFIMATCFAGNALCCIVILAIVFYKRRRARCRGEVCIEA